MKLILKGLAASSGEADGIVRVVSGIEDAPLFKEGEILVTTITDPSMVAMMARASAIVTDIGGVSSHPAIVSRELGIPCVTATKTATKVLKNGQKVRVNGSSGEVFGLD